MKNILKIVILSMISLFMISCSQSKKDLYKETDKFVESLYTTYDSYGVFGGQRVITEDKLYQIMPMGRLINVKILKVADDDEYEDLRESLEKHYKGDRRVNGVYRCRAGTLMIDCRR